MRHCPLPTVSCPRIRALVLSLVVVAHASPCFSRSHRLPSFQRTPEPASGLWTMSLFLAFPPRRAAWKEFGRRRRPIAQVRPRRRGRACAPAPSASSYQPSGAERPPYPFPLPRHVVGYVSARGHGASGARSHSTRCVRELMLGKGAWRGVRTFRGPGYLARSPVAQQHTQDRGQSDRDTLL